MPRAILNQQHSHHKYKVTTSALQSCVKVCEVYFDNFQ